MVFRINYMIIIMYEVNISKYLWYHFDSKIDKNNQLYTITRFHNSLILLIVGIVVCCRKWVYYYLHAECREFEPLTAHQINQ